MFFFLYFYDLGNTVKQTCLCRDVNSSTHLEADTHTFCFRSQIRTTLKKKAFEDAGIPVRQVSSTVTSHTPQAPQVASTLSVINTQSVLGKNAEVQTFTNYKQPIALFFFVSYVFFFVSEV